VLTFRPPATLILERELGEREFGESELGCAVIQIRGGNSIGIYLCSS
jgi:hypothetical protein